MKINKLLGEDAETETKEDLYLPEEIMREIVRRLTIRSIIKWKCVSKLWRDIIQGGDFVTSQTPKLVFSLRGTHMVYDAGEACVPLFEFRTHTTYIHMPHVTNRLDSVNGLILLRYGSNNILVVCNPITREYVELPPQSTHSFIFGFGVSKLTGKYKILYGDKFGSYYILTLGEESWRRIPEATLGILTRHMVNYDTATFFNGNLHWLASDKGNRLICCFDLETELFTNLSLPPLLHVDSKYTLHQLCILEGRLCLCLWDYADRIKFVYWWMNDYEDENSWVKEYTLDHCRLDWSNRIWPLKVLTNGDLLFYNTTRLFIYSKKTRTVVTCDGLPKRSRYDCSSITIYTPSFLSLKAMGIHNVRSLPFFYRDNNTQSLNFY